MRNSCCASYVIVAMLDDFYKGFSLFIIQHRKILFVFYIPCLGMAAHHR